MFLEIIRILLCSTATTDPGYRAVLPSLSTFTLIWSYLMYSVQRRRGCTQALRHGHSPRQPYPADTSGVIREPGLFYL